MENDLKHARAYINAMPPAISGAGGHKAAFAAVTVLRHGFALSDADAWSLFLEYNQRCRPPWSSTELKHKFDSVDSSKHPMSRGYLAKKRDFRKKSKNKSFPSHLLTRRGPINIERHSPKKLGEIKLPDWYLETVKIENIGPTKNPTVCELEGSDPMPPLRTHGVPPGRCAVCWTRWGRFLRDNHCICTGDVQS
jgi:hypothetical protein